MYMTKYYRRWFAPFVWQTRSDHNQYVRRDDFDRGVLVVENEIKEDRTVRVVYHSSKHQIQTA